MWAVGSKQHRLAAATRSSAGPTCSSCGPDARATSLARIAAAQAVSFCARINAVKHHSPARPASHPFPCVTRLAPPAAHRGGRLGPGQDDANQVAHQHPWRARVGEAGGGGRAQVRWAGLRRREASCQGGPGLMQPRRAMSALTLSALNLLVQPRASDRLCFGAAGWHASFFAFMICV
jgi:hypothetical protein